MNSGMNQNPVDQQIVPSKDQLKQAMTNDEKVIAKSGNSKKQMIFQSNNQLNDFINSINGHSD
jgi:hypothetical protein